MSVKISCEGFSIDFDCRLDDREDMDVLTQAFLLVARRCKVKKEELEKNKD